MAALSVKATAASEAGQKAPKKKKRPPPMILFGGLGAFGLITLFTIALMMPDYGSPLYGVCKVFVELTQENPQEMTVVSVDEGLSTKSGGPRVRMEYTTLDGMGQFSINQINCDYRITPEGYVVLERADVNGNEGHYFESKDYIERFNKMIPTVLSSPVDLALPPPLPEDIIDLQR